MDFHETESETQSQSSEEELIYQASSSPLPLRKPKQLVSNQTGQVVSLFESREHLERNFARIQLESGVEKSPVEWRRTPFRILRSVYQDSGRYFCVFSEKSSEKIAVTSIRVSVFDSKCFFVDFVFSRLNS